MKEKRQGNINPPFSGPEVWIIFPPYEYIVRGERLIRILWSEAQPSTSCSLCYLILGDPLRALSFDSVGPIHKKACVSYFCIMHSSLVHYSKRSKFPELIFIKVETLYEYISPRF